MPTKRVASADESSPSSSSIRRSTRAKKPKQEEISDDVSESLPVKPRISRVIPPISPVKAPTLEAKGEDSDVFEAEPPSVVKTRISPVKAPTFEAKDEEDSDSRFIGNAVPNEEARRRWPHRYQEKNKQDAVANGLLNNAVEITQARCHYTQAKVDDVTYNLNDDAYVQGEEGKENYICKIIEMFVAVDGTLNFRAQWYYRAKDTVIKDHGHLIDDKRVFFSEIKDDNPLDCLVQKLDIAKVALNVDVEAQRAAIPLCDYYYDMMYLLPFSTFIKVPQENFGVGSDSSSRISSVVNMDCETKSDSDDASHAQVQQKMFLLDLYCGCGAMSTGLCLGAKLSGINLVTRWAVDLNTPACESLQLNHPETEVRNEAAEDFLSLLKEWKKLCIMFSLISGETNDEYFDPSDAEDESSEEDTDNMPNDNEKEGEIFEVAKILAISYRDPKGTEESGLHFKVRWKGYGPSEDSWEPVKGLSNCRKTVKEFVTDGFKSKVLPLPGDAHVICGGPPCQGISGFNRFRNKQNPLEDPKNAQLLVYMNIVDYLKPKFVLMENVVDLLKFSSGFLGRYGLGRLIQMNYQTRIGMMAAGSYGLPQYRMRVFMLGALPTETLPQYPLPTHDAIVRGVIPLEFEENVVRHNETINLEKRLVLEDAISDLPPITNSEQRDEMPYGQEPKTDFQRYIRLGKDELIDATSESRPSRDVVFDHRALELNTDDYDRVCEIPKEKGANFRHLPGVRVRADNKVEFDPDVPRVLLRSGKPLVPDYAMSFVNGTSSKPFARLWWDETVPTVVTRAEPHNQKIIHPAQDRVLSIRENARLQGFPDYYKLCGPVKERYTQVGNAVAVPVARSLGFALGMAIKGTTTGDAPVFALPPRFPFISDSLLAVSSEDEA